MRSYLIIAIYSILIAIFFTGEVSLFLIVASLVIEAILLWFGSVIVGNILTLRKAYDENRDFASFIGLTTVFGFIIIIPIAYVIGRSYGEFTVPTEHGGWQPIYDYKYELMIITVALGLSYYSDIKLLKSNEDFIEYFYKSVFRVVLSLFVASLIGFASIEFVKEFIGYKSIELPGERTLRIPANKSIPFLLMTGLRIGIEISILKGWKTKVNRTK